MAFKTISIIGKIFKSILSGVAISFRALFSLRSIFFVFGWRTFVMISIIVLFGASSVVEAVQQHDGKVLIERVGGFFFGVDEQVQVEVDRVLENHDSFTFWDWLMSYINIMGNFYLLYYIFYIGGIVVNFFTDQSAPMLTKGVWTLLFVLFFRTAYIGLMIATGLLDFQSDFGGNGFRLLFPYFGFWNFLKNINLWAIPILGKIT